MVLALLGAAAVQGITSYSLTQLLSKAAQRMIADLRRQVQAHIGRLAGGLPRYEQDRRAGHAHHERRRRPAKSDRHRPGGVGGQPDDRAFRAVVLLRISVFMTGVAFAILVVFAVGLNRAFGTIRPIYRARSRLNAEVTGRLTESLAGVRVVKGYRAEEREEKVFAGGVQRLLDNVLKTLTATSVMSLSSTVLLGLVSALITYLGARRIIAGTMTLGTFFTYVAFLALLVAPIFQIVSIGTQLTEGMAGLERTSEILGEKPGRRRSATHNIDRHGARRSGFRQRRLRLRSGKARAARCELRGAAGQRHRAGRPVRRGQIHDHRPDRGLLHAHARPGARGRHRSFARPPGSYRTQLGVVLQETFLFDGTIRDNVLFSRPDASEDDILAACRIARVDEFAESFELKYDTVVGERGVKLSGGQRQRISIARAILADPRILILDEATSSLDSESEALIQQGLSYLMRGRTTFVIAHRLSTIRRADQILVIEAGRIIERGTHQTLYALGGRYFDLYTKQHGLQSNLFLAPGEGDSKPAEGEAGANGDAEASTNGSAPSAESGVARAARILRGSES